MDNAKKNKTNLALYIVLALIIVAVVCMTVFSIATGSKKNEERPPVKVTDTSKNTEKNDKNDRPESDTYVTEDEETSGEAPDETTADTPSVDVSAPVRFNVTQPVKDGYLLKAFDIEMPVYSLTMNDYRVHTGIDILADVGAPVMAIAEGTVQNIYNDPMMGNCISISHTDGLVSYYMGMSDEVCEGIEEGAPVFCGQNISSIGDSTLVEIAEESHLHFEMKKNGKYVDPMAYFSYDLTTSENAVDDDYEG